MTDTVSTTQERARRLEDALRREVEGEGRDAVAKAEQEAASLLKGARKRARRRVHHGIEIMRRQRAEKLVKAHARAARMRREAHQQRIAASLTVGMAALRAALRERWRDAGSRRAWCDAILGEAMERLEPGLWTVEGPADWGAGEQAAMTERLRQAAGNEPRFAADPAIEAGIRIVVGEACLDGTVAGLLADRAAIEAELLALIEDEEGEAGKTEQKP